MGAVRKALTAGGGPGTPRDRGRRTINIPEKEGTPMRKSRIILGFLLVTVLGFGTVAPAQSADDIAKHPSCKYCGMDRNQFAHSRMLIEYDDGTSVGLCSIHCAAVDLSLNIDKTPQSIRVGDYKTKKLIEAEAATWVLGGNKPGVMSKRAKWAFEGKEDAQGYVKENGGELVVLDDAMKASYEDMYSDTKMIREKRKMMKSKQGEPKK